MENKYWKDNNLISASLKEKKELLDYEIFMFKETCRRLGSRLPVFENNLLFESLAIHSRTLIDFFYNKKRYLNDVIAQDLLPKNLEWKTIRPNQTQLLIDAKNKADKQLAHLSTWRLKLVRDGKKDWGEYPKIQEDLSFVIKKFKELTK